MKVKCCLCDAQVKVRMRVFVKYVFKKIFAKGFRGVLCRDCDLNFFEALRLKEEKEAGRRQ